MPWLLFAYGFGFLALVAAARAQSTSAIFNGPQNMDPGLRSGLNNLTGCVAVPSVEAKTLENKMFGLSGGGKDHRTPRPRIGVDVLTRSILGPKVDRWII